MVMTLRLLERNNQIEQKHQGDETS